MIIPWIFIITLILWLVVPVIKDMLGYNQDNNLDVYKAYVKLQQVKRAKKNH